MGWITLAERKMSLINPINETEKRIADIARERRAVHRELSFEQVVIGNDKSAELRNAQEGLDAIKDARPSVGSVGYDEWKEDYEMAQEEFEAAKVDIEAYYDNLLAQIEQDATDREADLEQEQTVLETQLEAMRAEKDAVGEQISADMDDTKLNFGG